MATTTLAGLDSLLSTVQMPGGVAGGLHGNRQTRRHQCRNLRRPNHRDVRSRHAQKLVEHKEQLVRAVVEKSEKLKREFKI